MQTCRSSRKSLSIFPVPSTTEASGSSAIETGKPVSSRMRLSKFFSSAPPPVSTMPRSLMSAESSGGVRSSATRIAFRIVATHSQRQPLLQRIPRADLHLDLFRGTLAHQQVVFALQILHHRFVHLIA